MFKIGEYVVLDIETTGLSRYYHKITEIAAIRYKDGKAIEEFESLVNPEVPIPRFITRLTGIDDDMVKDADPIEKVMPKFLSFLGDSVIVAHNATFDYGFLRFNAQELGLDLENEKLCTRRLANRLLPELPSKRLGCLCEHFGVNNEQAHRAMGDTRVTVDVLSGFLQMLEGVGIKDQEVLEFQMWPRRKCEKLFDEE